MTDQKEGELRVWWIPQVGSCKPFHVPVADIEQAILALNTLADYDLFQLANNIKPDFCNVGGLEVYEIDAGEGAPGWCDWESAEGDDIDSIIRERAQ